MEKIDKTKLSKEIKDKSTILNNTFIQVAKKNPKDKIEVEIGDIKQPDFKPQFKVKRWDNEHNFSLRLKTDEKENAVISSLDNKVIWEKGKTKARFYELPKEEHPEGAIEFDVILDEMPTSNRLVFTYKAKDVKFYHQPEITDEEAKPLADRLKISLIEAKRKMRPENVVNSYAIYTSTKKINIVGGKEYKTGKIGHLYRPLIYDAKGTKVYGELELDEKTEEIAVIIPQEFLNKAVFPVVVDPTFGYTSIGATGESLRFSDDIYATIGSASNGDVDSVSAYLKKDSAGTGYLKGLIISTSKTFLTDGISDATAITDTAEWYTANYSTKPHVSNTNYYVGWIIDSATRVWLDSGGDTIYDQSNSYASPTNPTDASSSSATYSIYATYTAALDYPKTTGISSITGINTITF